MNTDAQGWSLHAPDYVDMAAPYTGIIARGMLALVEDKLALNARVLDIACGTGALAIPALERAQRERASAAGTGGVVFATDFAAGMVDQMRIQGKASGADANMLVCEVQNGEALSYADASFDAVFSCFGIFLFADRRAGWREATRVLRPGGVFATTVWQGPEHNPLVREQGMPVGRALPERLRPKGGGGWMKIATADALVNELRATEALIDIRCRPFKTTFVFRRWQRLWDTLRTNPVMGAVLAKCTKDELETVRASALSHWRELAGGDAEPLVLDSVCNVVTANRAP